MMLDCANKASAAIESESDYGLVQEAVNKSNVSIDTENDLIEVSKQACEERTSRTTKTDFLKQAQKSKTHSRYKLEGGIACESRTSCSARRYRAIGVKRGRSRIE